MSQIKVNSLIHSTGTANNIVFDNAGSITVGNQLKVNTITHPTSTANNIILDNAGSITVGNRLSLPLQPSFLAGINSNSDASVTVGTAIVANVVQYNVGNCYSSSTGRFTAPVAGLYNFTVGIYFTNSGTQTQLMQVGLRKNGSYLNGGSDAYGNITVQPNAFAQGVMQSVLQAQFLLAANDYIDIAPRNNTLRHYQGHFWFQGYLIG